MSMTTIDPRASSPTTCSLGSTRAPPTYDRENRFFDEDWDELRESGYLLAAVPTEFGGAGLGLDEVVNLQGRLAYHAPATAVAVNMHLYWTGVAADLLSAGDTSCDGCSRKRPPARCSPRSTAKRGNDMPVLVSSSTASPRRWRLDDHRPQDLRQPLAGVDLRRVPRDGHLRSGRSPKIVHGFVRTTRPASRSSRRGTRSACAPRRATTRVLTEAFVPDEDSCWSARPASPVPGRSRCRSSRGRCCGFATVYSGAARRAFDITVEKLPKRTSVALTRSMAHHPEVQHHVSEMRIALDAADALLHVNARDWTNGVAHADWPVRLVALRHFVINQAYDIVDRAMDLSGGSAVFKRNRLEQIFRDVRMGRFHPATPCWPTS